MECGQCKSIQIIDKPDNLDDYYPIDYYAFKKEDEDANASVKNKLTRLINERVKERQKVSSLKWLKKLSIEKNDPVLDVGCGTGKLLLELQDKGFRNLVGCDPYINEDIRYDNGPEIFKKEIYEMTGQYKLIMMHHSFEHMYESGNILDQIFSLFSRDGILLIRIPVANSMVFKLYKENWVQLDAPRHMVIPSVNGMKVLCGNHGLQVMDVDFDSKAFQFYGSKQYKMGIPLMDERTYINNPNQRLFKRYEIWYFKIMAHLMNFLKKGDSAIYYIKKK